MWRLKIMSELIFREMGYRRPTGYDSLQKILSYIEQNDLGSQVIIDLRGCVFSYPLAQILEAIVLKIKELPGEKSITLVHGYSSAFEDHFAPYLTKKIKYIPEGITTLKKLKEEIYNKHNVIFNILEKKYGQ